jgi:hypothetical protein
VLQSSRAIAIPFALMACGESGGTTADAAIDAPPNDGRIHVDDGTPTRVPCTSSFGTQLTSTPTFGRLDGYLVAIVPPSGSNACNADSSHLHLQIRMNGAVYDVAVTISDTVTNIDDVKTATRDMAMPVNLPWAEGWHTGLLTDYVSLGVHSPDLQLQTKAELTTTLTTDLANANHISVYGTTYGADGAHLIHRNGGGHDGVIVTDPQSIPAHLRFFSFTDQAF